MKKRVLLLGLGRANISVAEYLLKEGDELFLYEENLEVVSTDARRLLKTGKIKTHNEGDFDYDLVVTSPGFPPNKRIIKELTDRGLPVIDEIEFTYQHLNRPDVIAVTGTNGKSTTAALISNILASAGIKNFLGGNIAPGMPFSRALFLPRFEQYVLEISSFQLMRIRDFHAGIGVLTNISADHLNWHSSFEEYKQAKFRLFKTQRPDDYAVLNFDDQLIKESVTEIRSQIIFFGGDLKADVCFNGDFRYKGEKLFPVKISELPGRHNILNTLAAIAVAKIIGVDNESIRNGITSFKSLPHRLEELGVINGVRYINNSMCTNESAAIASFNAVKGDKIVIVGGRQKGNKGEKYLDLLVKKAKACIVLGENAFYITDYFKTKKFDRFAVAEDMDDAVEKARGFAANGDIILLNPGFASFGHFRNFEERGAAFKDAAYRD